MHFSELEIYRLFTNCCRQNQSQTIMSAGKHADLIRKVESLSALTDSNRLLREEKQKIEALVHAATTEAEQARASVASLQVSVRFEGARAHSHYRG
jgi:nucleoprotein TPR